MPMLVDSENGEMIEFTVVKWTHLFMPPSIT